MKTINMRQMCKNQEGIISSVTARGVVAQRIREMGLVSGTPVRIQGRAPLNDPVALRLMGFTLALRNNEADFIQVEVQ
ncbi:Fe(2+) transport protein A [Desulfonema limicola]|uniref:Fe(2+) transport protein A n=1 Tax=Desulfonema limicola TaxID=45656 RepID=A0A975GGU9_9BACT|nr:FeoA domain-containing protein [Desulfonema limicola]QTA80711.1 Fe(2+) transport protein A [Desulfonema limicola]